MRSTIIFSSRGNTVKNKSDIRFQYLVYDIIHTCNINDNRVFKVTLLSISELYVLTLHVSLSSITMFILCRVFSQNIFVRTFDFFAYVLNPYHGVFATHSYC